MRINIISDNEYLLLLQILQLRTPPPTPLLIVIIIKIANNSLPFRLRIRKSTGTDHETSPDFRREYFN
jgi:hypothetical protein